MKKVEAIIRQEKIEELKAALNLSEITSGMTVNQVLGYGKQKGLKEYIRGQAVITTLLPKVTVCFVVEDQNVEPVIDLIIAICNTDEVGDGKIFVYPVEEAVRIRTKERGSAAL
ncbi:P-II family nitrogen regulator [Enterococcus sp.]|uniref:P-II family nitrogen regulator n=1 Tax=Enterococcus sp. TaxID=35783 RepID=UPI00289FFCD9|nr:P-II family nitrogen regulator [Enterococcus sp.]